jgi:tetratricopeptide (TPR) repeat protein
MRLLSWAGPALAMIMAAPASAAWNVAESKHFVIYADQNPKALYDFATRLERFDQAARYATHAIDPEIGDGNRLTVFVLPTVEDVRAIYGDGGRFLNGFYTGRVSGSLAYVPRRIADLDQSDVEQVFFHEYTHHLMAQDLERPYPQWYFEGIAEFFSTPRFDKDGSVWFGRPPQGRAYGLFEGPKMPVESLFQGMKSRITLGEGDVFYGRGWLLTHYLLLGSDRRGQLVAYFSALARGTPPLDAASQSFGDLNRLDKDLDNYRNQRLLSFQIAARNIHLQPIKVTQLSDGGAAVILARARIKNGVPDAKAEAAAAEVRQIESRFPGDELVERTLAEAELNAKHWEAAEAAADRALAANSRSIEAVVTKGKAMIEQGRHADDKSRHPLFEKARKTFIAANQLDTEDPEPLFEFYNTFAHEGLRPTANAIAALHYSSDLAPQDMGVRMTSAVAYLNEGKPKEARAALTVVAYSPHAGPIGKIAQKMMADIDAGKPNVALEETSADAEVSSK